MTPLAQGILNELCKPLRERDLFDPDDRAKLVSSAHCFELTAVLPLLDMLEQNIYDTRLPQRRLAFLPSPVTIIDFHDPEFMDDDDAQSNVPRAARDGVMLIESDDKLTCDVYAIGGPPLFSPHLTSIGKLRLRDEAELSGFEDGHGFLHDGDHDQFVSYRRRKAGIYAALALINTPRTIGRRTHLPHAGLQRKLARARGMVGKFPLHAWTEVILEVRPPRVDERDTEVSLTGGRALHFCRAYLRVRNGMVQIVSSHWRGDPALGLKQTRYRLVKEKQHGSVDHRKRAVPEENPRHH